MSCRQADPAPDPTADKGLGNLLAFFVSQWLCPHTWQVRIRMVRTQTTHSLSLASKLGAESTTVLITMPCATCRPLPRSGPPVTALKMTLHRQESGTGFRSSCHCKRKKHSLFPPRLRWRAAVQLCRDPQPWHCGLAVGMPHRGWPGWSQGHPQGHQATARQLRQALQPAH